MRTLRKILPLTLSLTLSSGLLLNVPAEEPESFDQQKDRTEINPRNLPVKARDAIFSNFHNGQITKTFKLSKGDITTGYLVEIRKNDETWVCEFDKEGKLISRNANRGNL